MHTIPDDWMDSQLAAVPKPEKDQTSIKGYRIVTMQNTVGKLLIRLWPKDYSKPAAASTNPWQLQNRKGHLGQCSSACI